MIAADKFIFVHVPKTGGQSITIALGGRTPGIALHTPLFAAPDPAGRLTFGFVRNPWARLVSLYCFLCQKRFKPTDNFDQDQVRAIGFKSWLMSDRFFMAEDGLPPGEAWRIRHAGGLFDDTLPPMQRRPQMFWLDGCQLIGRFESLTDDFAEICKLIGMAAPTLPHVNASEHAAWRGYYDDESRRFVAEHFQKDLEQFNYQF